ncbi:MAG: SUMF1/EgtB/PvdO family nonheme iron enzyme [Planctomycetota bacterium]|nr:SUMF1/EgtB/PvdO family nonheme iron enzyme [Planctomycetota bacterium]
MTRPQPMHCRAGAATLALPALLALGILLGCGQPTGPTAATPPLVKTAGGVEMVLIPAGEADMGSNRKAEESPVHKVKIASFLMDRCEVTQEQLTRLQFPDPSQFKGPTLPAELSRGQAALFCNARSSAEGLEPCYSVPEGDCNFNASGYRLPTEAEWEYACRAGSKGEYCFGSDPRFIGDHAWYGENASKRTHPVAQKKSNPWGLYDMYGNVAEWCNDVYDKDCYKTSPAENPRGPADGSKYVLRGGAWSSSAESLRSSARAWGAPGFQDACFSQDAIGFRCVRKAPDQAPGAAAAGGGGGAGVTIKEETAGPGDKEKQPAPTGFLYDPIYLQHKVGAGFPERPERLEAIVKRLKEKGLDRKLTALKAAPAGIEWLTTVHSAEYVARARKACEDAGDEVKQLDTGDMPISGKSYEAAINAVGGVLAAVDAVVDGKVRNAFCAVRPPGHHALKDKPMGFCMFGNVAIAARYIQQKHKLAKVLIVDWDVHHGNGTQYASYDDPTILHFDVHRSPFYPGSGSADEKGIAEQCRQGRSVSVLEGGYSLEGLADSVEAHIRVLME